LGDWLAGPAPCCANAHVEAVKTVSQISERKEVLVGKSDSPQPELRQAYDYSSEKKADISMPALSFENALMAAMGSYAEWRRSVTSRSKAVVAYDRQTKT
jgi:hypothetical protein